MPGAGAIVSPGSARSLHIRGSGRRLRGARHGGRVAALFELRENLLGRREAEVGQHHDHLLLVALVALIADDQGCGHHQLLLQTLVGVHPEHPAEAQREVIVGIAARRYRRVRRRHARRPAAMAA
jgi:hypothetical protein